MKPTIRDIQETQLAVLSKRGYMPNCIIMNGGVANEILGIDEYDPRKSYMFRWIGSTVVVTVVERD